MLCVVPPPGAQLYDPPGTVGVAVSTALPPVQMALLLTDTVGAAVTVTVVVAVQPLTVHVRVYVPATVNPLTVVVAEFTLAKVTVAGLPAFCVQVPVPEAAIAVVAFWQRVWAGPAFGGGDTVTCMVSAQP